MPRPPITALYLNCIPRPRIVSEYHVQVRVTHAALNPSFDMFTNIAPNPFNQLRIPEFDFAAEITAVSDSVRSAEYIVVHQDYVLQKTQRNPLVQAVVLCGVCCTAIRFLDYSKIRQDDWISLNGGSGGCGTMLVQIAKHTVGLLSGKVVVTCSTANVEMLK